MDLTANEMRSYEFQSQLRGYDKDEVDSFRDQAAGALEMLQAEKAKLATELESIKGQLAGLRQFEDAIKNAAIDARKNADATLVNARKEAEKILSDAKSEAQRIIQSNRIAIEAIEYQLTEIKLTRKSYLKKLRDLLKNHLSLVDSIDKEEPSEPKKREDQLHITDSSEVDESQVESLANTEEPEEIENKITQQATMTEGDQTLPPKDQSESSEQTDTEKLKDVLSEDPPDQEKKIDPELATALQNYKKNVEADEKVTKDKSPAPKPGELIETNARAEDVPEGFVAMGNEIQTPAANPANSAPPSATETPTKDVDLASELDNVAAKFEEEMDKAEKS